MAEGSKPTPSSRISRQSHAASLRMVTVTRWARALVITGLLHAVWHLPIVFLTNLYLPHGSRWLVVPAFVVTVVSGGVLMGWLRLRTGSVWPAVLAHSAHNAAVAGFGAYTIGDPVLLEHVAGESGVLTVVGYAAVAAWLLVRAPQPAGGVDVQSRGVDLPVGVDAPRALA